LKYPLILTNETVQENPMNQPKPIAIIGTGSRAEMYLASLATTYRHTWNLVALCDPNPGRLDFYAKELVDTYNHQTPALYHPDDVEIMIKTHNIHTVIVVTIDRTHDEYICRAMEAGCDVITEKPLTIDPDRLKRIWEVKEKTGKSLRVGFNYRYAPRNTRVKELLDAGTIGKVLSVHFEWLLDTSHGADYFRRWHRNKRNSGGLMVHKSTHHFDLMNWWLADTPSKVFASGDLMFYGRENAEKRGQRNFSDRGTGDTTDPFALDLKADPKLKALYYDVESHDGYRRDESVFGNYISIEDDMSVIVEYTKGTRMTYHLTAYSPYEGFRIGFNGEKGRIEYTVLEASYISGSQGDVHGPQESFNSKGSQEGNREKLETVEIKVIPHWQKGYVVPFENQDDGGHGGGDAILLADLFADPKPADPFGCAAGIEDGAYSIAVGIGANMSMSQRRLVDLREILPI
jgi:predicted dehydrogenase